MTMEQTSDKRLSLIVTHMMRGILYREEKPDIWEALLGLEAQVRDYLVVMGLDVQIYDSDGFAYLEIRETPDGEVPLPRMISRRALSYPVSLLLVLLRRKLTELDSHSGETRLILDRNEIDDMITAFFPRGTNEVKYLKRVDSWLQRIYDLGFIRYLGDKKDKIEVKRILKAFIDAQWLSDFNEKLEEYAAHGRRIRGEDE